MGGRGNAKFFNMNSTLTIVVIPCSIFYLQEIFANSGKKKKHEKIMLQGLLPYDKLPFVKVYNANIVTKQRSAAWEALLYLKMTVQVQRR